MTCPHGEIHPSACVDCLEGEPPELEKWAATRTLQARYPSDCARNPDHRICERDTIHYVAGEGWCCGRCARPARPATISGRTWRATGWVYQGVQVIQHESTTQMWCRSCGAVANLPPSMKRPKIQTAADRHIADRHPTKDTTT